MRDSPYPWGTEDFDCIRRSAGEVLPPVAVKNAAESGKKHCCNVPPQSLIRRQFQLHLIDEAPAPILAGLERCNDGMVGAGRVLARVTIFRIVAAPHVTAAAAQAQVHPRVAADQAFHTPIARRGHWLYTAQMLATLIGLGHVSPGGLTMARVARHECNNMPARKKGGWYGQT